MSNEQISPKQGITMIIMFIIGTSSIMVTGMRAGRDIWIADLLALVASLPIIMIYIRLLTLAPGKDFFQTIEYVIGKTASKLFLIPMTWYAFHLCALVLRNFGQFVVTVALHETPLYAVILLIMVFCIMAVRSGLEVLGRWSESFILFLVSFFGLGILLTTKNMNIQNILPVLDSSILLISRAAFGIMVFPFTQIVVFLLVFPAFKKTSSIKKVFLKGILFGGIVILITSITDMLVLGLCMQMIYIIQHMQQLPQFNMVIFYSIWRSLLQLF